jgi:hypothetical protein
MGNHFKQFCDNIPKNRNGYVPYLMDLDSDFFRDLAVSAYILDKDGEKQAKWYLNGSTLLKNSMYSDREVAIQDAIDSYNDGIDSMAELELLIPLSEDEELFLDEPYTAEAYGHKPGDFC